MKTARNKELHRRYQAGESVCALASEFDITRQRVHQIVQKEAAAKGKPLRPTIAGGRLVPIPNDVRERFFAGEITVEEVAEIVDLMPATVATKLGVSRREIGKQQTLAKYENIYNKFMTGTTLKQLADEFDTSIGSVAQCLNRYREATGKPCKMEWDIHVRKRK